MDSHYIHNFSATVSLFNEQIPIYWLIYPLGFFIIYFAGRLTLERQKKPNISADRFSLLMIFGWAGVLLGGRIGYILAYNFNFFLNNPEMTYQFWHGGMSFHGAIIGIAVSLFLFSKNWNEIYSATDIAAFFAPIVLLLGRVANFLNGELPGRVTDSSWAIIFPKTDIYPRHPSQLYEALGEGLILFLILWMNKKQLRRPRAMTSYFLFFYGLIRFIIEFFREPDPQIGYLLFHLSMGQWLCIVMMAIGPCILFSEHFSTKQPNAS